jgi:hypothetical protein
VVVKSDGFPEQSSEEAISQTDQVFDDLGPSSIGEPGRAVGSILVADCGSSFTRVSLLERVETGYCFVAHAKAETTAEPPWSDISVGVRHAIEQITETTRRMLLDDAGALLMPEMGGKGVDLFVLTSSAGQPLRVVLAGLVSQVSLASLERAAAGSYVDVLGVIARDHVGPSGENGTVDARTTNDWVSRLSSALEAEPPEAGLGLTDEDKISLIRQQSPDVVWVAGGTDGGSREPVRDLVETVALACKLVDRSPQPGIVYAGNAELRSEIVDLIGEEVQLEVINNVRPTLDTEDLVTAQAAFQTAYVHRKVQRLPGIGSLIGWSSAPVVSTAQAFGYLVQYLERLYESGKGVLCADVGSANTVVAASLPGRFPTEALDRTESADGGQHTLQVATDLGVGYGAPALLKRVGVPAIAKWLPFEPELGEVEGVLLNKGVRPMTIPTDRRQLLIEQAAAREALRLVMSCTRGAWQASTGVSQRWMMPLMEPIVASGGILAQAPRLSQTVLMLLDAIEPVGITTFVLDNEGIASALGAIAITQPLAAVQALDSGPFLTLGTVVAPIGRARPGDVIMRVKIAFEQGGELEIEARYGSLEMLPLRLGEKAVMEIRPRRGIRVGQASGAIEVHGGAVGLVIDARGRPLRLPSDPDACRQLVQQWLWEMGA